MSDHANNARPLNARRQQLGGFADHTNALAVLERLDAGSGRLRPARPSAATWSAPPGTYTASYSTDAATCEVLSTGTGVPSAA